MAYTLAVIFDLDGVLVNTVDCHYAAWAAVARRMGRPFSKEMNDRLRGVPRHEALRRLAHPAKPLDPPTERSLMELKASAYLREVRARGATLVIPGVRSLLMQLRRLGIGLALASASRNATHLMTVAGIAGFFDLVSDGHFLGRPKPHPEQLLHLAAKLRVRRKGCLVLEDSAAGLAAARSAGMASIAIGPATNQGSHLPSLIGCQARHVLGLWPYGAWELARSGTGCWSRHLRPA